MKKQLLLTGAVSGILLLGFPEVISAATTTGLPWEGPLKTIQNSFSGPIAMSVAIISIVASGAALIFGGEIGEFARKMIIVVLVLAMVVAANSVLSTLFGVSGAMVI